MSVDIRLYASILLNEKRMPLVLLMKIRVDEWDVLICLGLHWLCMVGYVYIPCPHPLDLIG